VADDHSSADDGVFARIDELHAGICAQQRELLRCVALCETHKPWERDGYRDMAQWLSGRLGISTWAARRWVGAAHALEELPRISGALGGGALSLDKVLELCRFATPETETRLIKWARRVSAAAIRRRADVHNCPSPEDTGAADDARFLRWWWFEDGNLMGLEGLFPAGQGAAIAAALRRVADQLPEDRPHGSGEHLELPAEIVLEQRCADALHALASQSVGADADADRATVVVHTTLGARDGHGGEIESGPVIHPELARRLSCDARLQFVLTDADGNALGIGRASRNVPPWLMRELRHRDYGCTFPGCGTRAFLQAHHIWHWERGGPTDLGNLVLTCHFHHKLVHEHGWGVSLNGSAAQWFRPEGRHFNPGPDPPGRWPIERVVTSPEPDQLSIAV